MSKETNGFRKYFAKHYPNKRILDMSPGVVLGLFKEYRKLKFNPPLKT